MTFLRISRKAVFSLVLALVAIPALSYADVFTCGLPFSNSCTSGTLHTYVLVQKNTTVAPERLPSDFTLTLRAQNLADLSFRGSQSGTHTSVSGTYAVEALSTDGYSPIYSQGCQGVIGNREEATCVVTMSPSSTHYFGAVTPYPYTYTHTVLACAPAYQTVTLGQSASFTAIDGAGTYNWSTPDRVYLAVGPRLTHVPRTSGVQTVNVTSGTQTAVCTLNVLPVNGPVAQVSTTVVTPAAPVYYSPTSVSIPASVTSAPAQTPTYAATYVPKALPNTGFEPVSATQWAFAFAVLLAAGIFSAPYVRKTISFIS